MAAHEHSHSHPHHHAPGASLRRALWLTLGFSVVEAAGGLWSGSLALIGDAGHMLSDAFALGLAAFAAWLALKPPSARHTYGLVRAEIVAAFLNGLLMVTLIVAIAVEAVQRLLHPEPVAGAAVMGIASIGLVVNVFVAYTLSRGEQSLNTRAALLHVVGDMVGSVAALVSGAVIHFTGWTPVDPMLSLGLVGLILYSTLHLLREALHILMEGVPPEIDLEAVGGRLAALRCVRSVHDLHVWRVSGGTVALSAHLVLDDLSHWPGCLHLIRKLLHDEFDIDHVTLQPEVLMERNGLIGHIPIHPT